MTAKNFALGFGVAVIFPMLIHYGVSTFSPEPKLQDYGTNGYFDFAHASREERIQHQTDQKKASDQWMVAHTRFELYLFVATALFGVVAILCGACLRLPAIGSGLIFGGIFSVCNGFCHYWFKLSDALRFSALLLAFAVLIWVGYKKLDQKTT